MTVKTQFSSNADRYENYSIIQRKAIQKLLTDSDHRPSNILDLGCGTGRLFRSIDWPIRHFIALDFSKKMLAEHPKTDAVTCLNGDFNDPRTFDELMCYPIDRVYAASSLQWATDMSETFARIRSLGAPVSLAIFTANTFRTIFTTAGIPPLLRTGEEVSELAREYFTARFETVQYALEFDHALEMLQYIKRSGVSGARNILDYRETRALIRDYPLSYLEFEVLYIIE